MFRAVRVAALAAAIVAFAPPTIAGEENRKRYGAGAGYGIDPDQFVAGLQAGFGNTLKIAHLAASAMPASATAAGITSRDDSVSETCPTCGFGVLFGGR